MTDDELVRALFAYVEWEVAMRNAGRMRDAVEYRRLARGIGGQIRQRVDDGTWHGLKNEPNATRG